MGGEEPGTGTEDDGVETVMRFYGYPGQWFDDFGAVLAGTSPGTAWDFTSMTYNRDQQNQTLEAIQEMGLDPYSGDAP